MDLIKGESYLVLSRNGVVYFGEYDSCERVKYIGKKQLRSVNIFINAWGKTNRGNPSNFDYLHFATYDIRGVAHVDFNSETFLSMPTEELKRRF